MNYGEIPQESRNIPQYFEAVELSEGGRLYPAPIYQPETIEIEAVELEDVTEYDPFVGRVIGDCLDISEKVIEIVFVVVGQMVVFVLNFVLNFVLLLLSEFVRTMSRHNRQRQLDKFDIPKPTKRTPTNNAPVVNVETIVNVSGGAIVNVQTNINA